MVLAEARSLQKHSPCRNTVRAEGGGEVDARRREGPRRSATRPAALPAPIRAGSGFAQRPARGNLEKRLDRIVRRTLYNVDQYHWPTRCQSMDPYNTEVEDFSES